MSGHEPSTWTATVDKTMRLHARLLRENTTAQKRLEGKVDALIDRVDGFGLNGSGPAIKELAAASSALVLLAHCAPQLVEVATERRDTAATWRTLQRWVRWGKGTKAVLTTFCAGGMGTLTYYLAAHLWGLPGGGK